MTDRTVFCYCIRCHMPCKAVVDNDGRCVEWWETCDCAWQHEPCQDAKTLDMMDEKAREAWRELTPYDRRMLL